MEVVPRKYPRKLLPHSPMNIFAGGKLCFRNPSTLPRKTASIVATNNCCICTAKVKRIAPLIKATPALNPSMLSMRLKLFIIRRNQKAVRMKDSTGFERKKESRIPKAKIMITAITCRRSFCRALSALLSSIIPKITTTAPPEITAATCLSELAMPGT